MAALQQRAPIGSRVLVCGDLFDKDASHWQQSMGLGEFINTDPPAQTVFFEGKVKKHVANNEMEVYFSFDRSRVNIKPAQIYKVIDNDTHYPEFWVFRPGQTGIFRVRGVTFEKVGEEDIKMPQRFDTNNSGDARPLSKLVRRVTPVADGRRVSARLAQNQAPDATPVAAAAAVATVPAAAATPIRDGSESDNSFATDSDHECASEHEEDEEIQWVPPKNWRSLYTANPELQKFGDAVWRIPTDRTSLNCVHPQPTRGDTFHIKPEGHRPLLKMYLDAFPIESYWKLKKRETLRYAEQCINDPDNDTNQYARDWDPTWCTVANLLRVAMGVVMRGLCPAPSLQAFFQGYRHQVGSRSFGRDCAADFLKLSLLQYEQLQRFAHLANNETRPARESPDHDKCYLVRPTLTHAQSACKRWCTPGSDSAHDEAGFPSRHSWLRRRNASKPHKYFIELLMCCCSESRFCHTFFVNEGQTKSLLRPGRRTGQSKYISVPYRQKEYNDQDWDVHTKYGSTVAQMHYFSRKLREFDPRDNTHVYNIHCDKRWDSVIGMVLSKKHHNISYTGSVQNGSRYHVANKLGVTQSKKRANRGKYRSATTTIDGVTINAVQWMDNKLVGFASTQFGTSEMRDTRRTGRHKYAIPCPAMVVKRGQKFRAVDSNDQMRLSSCR